MKLKSRVSSLDYLYFIPLFLVVTTLPLTALISFAIYVVVYLVSCFFPSYGNFLGYCDVLVDEDFVNSIPQNSILVSMTLQGDLSLQKLTSIFTENVLKARSKTHPSKLRYLNLKQYLTTFICFRIWKTDPDFHIKNHVVEKIWDGTDLENIHQEYLNKQYQKTKKSMGTHFDS